MILALCLVLAPQTFESEAWFRLHPAPKPGPESRFVVSGKRPAAPAEESLRRLAKLMGWELREADSVRRRLAPVILDLAFTRQDPRIVAQLIAAAAGVEATLVRVGRRTELRIVESSAMPIGALRARAIEWDRGMLADPNLTGESRVEVLVGLGDALIEADDDRGAIRVFQQVFEQDETGRLGWAALLSAVGAHYRLATSADAPEHQRRADLQLAEHNARRVLQRDHPSLHAQAALLLGRILETAGRDSDCVELLEGQRARCAETPQHTDIRLLVASCYTRLALPDRALATLDSLLRPGAAELRWTRSQWLENHFLRGTNAEQESRGAAAPKRALRLADAMRSLEWYPGAGSTSSRRLHTALLSLGRVYLAKGKYLDARATVLRLLEREELDTERLQDARILEARTMTALGFGDRARHRLELVVRANPQEMPRVEEHLRDLDLGAVPVVKNPAERAFDAGRFEDALRGLAAVDSNPDASLADLYRLARCHEALHLRARRDPAVPIEQGARHLERAHDLFDRIERRNVVRGRDGQPTAGPWAIAACGARAMMRLADECPKWTPPRLTSPPR